MIIAERQQSQYEIPYAVGLSAFVCSHADVDYPIVVWHTSHDACKNGLFFPSIWNKNTRERESGIENSMYECASATECDCRCIKMHLKIIIMDEATRKSDQ